jgi:UDP-glucose 4-epimerase
MNILLTGGAGFIGSHITDALIKGGHSVSVIDNLSTGSMSNIHTAARFHCCDITHSGPLEEIFRSTRPDSVVHQAAQVNVRREATDMLGDVSVNVLGTVAVAQLCVRYGVRRLVFASSCAVYPTIEGPSVSETFPVNPQSAYGLSKYVGERYLMLCSELYGLRYVALRYGNVYGPRQNPKGECGVVSIFASEMLARRKPKLFGDGLKGRDYIHVSDVVSANIKAIECESAEGIFNIGSGIETKDIEVFSAVSDALGASVVPEYHDVRRGEVRRVCLDWTKAKIELKWAPRVDFRSGVRSTIESYVESWSAGPYRDGGVLEVEAGEIA